MLDEDDGGCCRDGVPPYATNLIIFRAVKCLTFHSPSSSLYWTALYHPWSPGLPYTSISMLRVVYLLYNPPVTKMLLVWWTSVPSLNSALVKQILVHSFMHFLLLIRSVFLVIIDLEGMVVIHKCILTDKHLYLTMKLGDFFYELSFT